jgi:hypothetical protein
MNRLAVFLLLVASFFGRAQANILSCSVSFDSTTNLYTYSYTLDNTLGLAAIDELSVLIDRAGCSVSFDSTTNLYTYSYALDNTFGPAAIDELSVLIDGAGFATSLEPAATTSRDGWFFHRAISGDSANPPLNEFGTFWLWQGGGAVSMAAGDTLGGFSFTTAEEPLFSNSNNRFLSAPTYTDSARAAFQRQQQFAPFVDPIPNPIPEPQTWLMLLAGTLGLLAAKRSQLRPPVERSEIVAGSRMKS